MSTITQQEGKQRDGLVAQRHRERASIALHEGVEGPLNDAIEKARPCIRLGLQEVRADHRRYGERYDDRNRDSEQRASPRTRADSRPTMPLMNSTGMNAAISEMLIESTVKPIWRAPSSAAAIGVMPRLEVAVDVLDHHDGVVDDEADGDREAPSASGC